MQRLRVFGSRHVSPPVVAYLTDLIFATKLSSTGIALGVGVKIVRTPSQLWDQLRAGGVRLVLVDLSAEGDPLDAIRRCRADAASPRIVAFGPHVEADLLAAAREAGAGEVLARSAFSKKLPALLQQAGNEAAVGSAAADSTDEVGPEKPGE